MKINSHMKKLSLLSGANIYETVSSDYSFMNLNLSLFSSMFQYKRIKKEIMSSENHSHIV